jgi:hypothetical protein
MKRKVMIAFVAAVICVASTSCSFSIPGKSGDTDTRAYLGEELAEPSYSEAVTEVYEEIKTEVTTEITEETTKAEEAVTEPAEEEITAESLIDGVDYFAHQYDITSGTISETAAMTAELDGETLDYTVYSNYSYKEYDETSYTGGTISSSVDDETYSAEYYSIYKDGYTTVYSKSSDEPGVWHKTTGSGKRRSYLGSTHFRELALEETDDQYIIKGQIKYAFLNQNLFGVIIPYGFEEAELSTLLDMTMYFDKETKEFKSYTVDFTPLLGGQQVENSTYNSFVLTVTMDGYEEGTLEIPEDVKNSAVKE